MRDRMDFSGDILARDISGFHQYDLSAPMHVDYASGNLCEMLGCTAEELLDARSDAYAGFVHPQDREKYQAFLRALSKAEGRQTLQYRLIHKSGTILYVYDVMTSRRGADGAMRGVSTLTDVTEIKKENEALHSLSETVPCGILRYTCEANPRVIYVNEQMLRMLRMDARTPGAAKKLEQCKENIYLLIPPDERDRFAQFLELVYAHDKPIAGEITAMRGDGTRFRVYGWIRKTIGNDGNEEFQSVCMDVTDRYERKHRQEEQRYMRALMEVYDEIFEYNFLQKTVRFLHGRLSERFGGKMPMLLEDATRYWVENVVVEADREKVRGFFQRLYQWEEQASEGRPLQLEFSTGMEGKTCHNLGVFLKTNTSNYLFCYRNITPQHEADRLKEENSALRSMNEQMQELVMHFTDGMLAFEIQDDCVRPLYVNDNICHFFGYTKEEWISAMQGMTPIRDFVSKCHLPYEAFLEFLENREVECHFTDVASNRLRRIKAIRTSSAGEGRRNSYVILYNVGDREETAPSTEREEAPVPEVYIRTFGYFDVFVDGNPIAFRNEKAKELFALLVDRRGGFVTSSEAISVLWEDEPARPVTLARYRKVALRLKNTLEEYGIADVMESVDGKRRIVTQMVRCDLYEYLTGEKQYAHLFKGHYLRNYSWGEETLAQLQDWPDA